MVVLGKGRVEGGSGEEEIELPLAGDSSPTVREAIEDAFQDKAVMDHDGLGDRARGGGEIAAEGDHDGISGEGARSSSSMTPTASVVAIHSGPRAVVSGGGSVAA